MFDPIRLTRGLRPAEMPKALVADNSQAIRGIVRKTLARLGYEVLEAPTGNESFALLDCQADISLILLDWNLPDLNGLDFVMRLRASPFRSQVVVMMVNFQTDVEQMLAALHAGANDYVVKPFTEKAVTDKLRVLGLMN